MVSASTSNPHTLLLMTSGILAGVSVAADAVFGCLTQAEEAFVLSDGKRMAEAPSSGFPAVTGTTPGKFRTQELDESDEKEKR